MKISGLLSGALLIIECAGVSLACAVVVPALRAQHVQHASADTSLDAAEEFVVEIRQGTTRFRQLEEAIAAGYRLVGPDFPGMGEHWVNVRLTMARRIDPAQPAVLSYLRVDDEPVLTGAAFAVPVEDGQDPPILPFPAEWHRHGGSIADETLHLNPHAMHAPSQSGPQLAMLHAWVWTENPAGTFVQQNWTLPFHRLGLDPPEGVTAAAGKAAHLLAGGVEYYAALIERAGRPSEEEMGVARHLLQVRREEADRVLTAWSADGMSDAECVDRLDLIWEGLWSDLLGGVTATVADRLRPLSM